MRLTRFSDYALRVMIYLASHEGRWVTVREIAEGYGISELHLRKVVHSLSREGWVESRRGRDGGIRLTSEARSLGVGDILRKTAIGAPLVECFDAATNTCTIASACTLKGILAEAEEAFYRHANRYTLQDLLPRRKRTELLRILST